MSDREIYYPGERIMIVCTSCSEKTRSMVIDEKGTTKNTMCRDCLKEKKYGVKA